MAFDAYDSGHAEEPIIFAQKGEMVTCDMCKLEIDHVRECFRGFRYVPNSKLNSLDAGGRRGHPVDVEAPVGPGEDA